MITQVILSLEGCQTCRYFSWLLKQMALSEHSVEPGACWRRGVCLTQLTECISGPGLVTLWSHIS